MVDITSGDMTLLFEAPDTVFDEARMTNEFGSDRASVSGGLDRIAGTTEVGVEKNTRGGPGGNRRVEMLLKSKVVLEKGVVGDGKRRWERLKRICEPSGVDVLGELEVRSRDQGMSQIQSLTVAST